MQSRLLNLCEFARSERGVVLLEPEGADALFQRQQRLVDLSALHAALRDERASVFTMLRCEMFVVHAHVIFRFTLRDIWAVSFPRSLP